MTGSPDLENLTDAELVACVVQPAVAGQQEAAFEAIYRRYAWAVIALCGGIIWDDSDTARTVAQDALVAAYRDLSSGHPPDQPEKLRAWLLGIAKNRCREEFRRRNRTGLMPDELPDDDWETASRRRQAEVDRILSAVATTFTGPQQRIYLRTFGHFTVNRPANGSHNLRISAVWIDSSDTVYAAAWPQPDFKPVNGSVPTVAVTPRVYRLDRRQWTDTGDTAASGSGGPDGWTAVLADNGSMTDGNGDWKGNLVVTSSQVHVTLAADVIAFAWAPPSSTAPPAPASSSGSPGEVQR